MHVTPPSLTNAASSPPGRSRHFESYPPPLQKNRQWVPCLLWTNSRFLFFVPSFFPVEWRLFCTSCGKVFEKHNSHQKGNRPRSLFGNCCGFVFANYGDKIPSDEHILSLVVRRGGWRQIIFSYSFRQTTTDKRDREKSSNNIWFQETCCFAGFSRVQLISTNKAQFPSSVSSPTSYNAQLGGTRPLISIEAVRMSKQVWSDIPKTALLVFFSLQF